VETAQHNFLDAQRRWKADEKGDSSCWRFAAMLSGSYLRPSTPAGTPTCG
jgi:hypothetical protein